MKKVLLISACVLFFMSCMFISYLGIYHYIENINLSKNMETICVKIDAFEIWNGRNPNMSFYCEDRVSYEICNIWYDEFDSAGFVENFAAEKEYSIIVNSDDIKNSADGNLVFVYGISEGDKTYLSSKSAISCAISNSI